MTATVLGSAVTVGQSIPGISGLLASVNSALTAARAAAYSASGQLLTVSGQIQASIDGLASSAADYAASAVAPLEASLVACGTLIAELEGMSPSAALEANLAQLDEAKLALESLGASLYLSQKLTALAAGVVSMQTLIADAELAIGGMGGVGSVLSAVNATIAGIRTELDSGLASSLSAVGWLANFLSSMTHAGVTSIWYSGAAGNLGSEVGAAVTSELGAMNVQAVVLVAGHGSAASSVLGQIVGA